MKIPFITFFAVILSTSVYGESSLNNENRIPVYFSPKVISNPAAPYPKKLLRECIGGKVAFKFTVMEDGRIQEIEIIESPHIQLSQAVVDTVRKYWLFASYTVKDSEKPVILKSHMSFYPEC